MANSEQQLDFQCTRKCFSVEIPTELMQALIVRDRKGVPTPELDGVLGLLDWNGHFGAFVFFECDVEDESQAKISVEAFLGSIL